MKSRNFTAHQVHPVIKQHARATFDRYLSAVLQAIIET